MIKTLSLILSIGFSLSVFAQQDNAKPKRIKPKPGKNKEKCEPEMKPDTAIIDLKTGRPKTAETDTTIKINKK